MWRLLQCSIKDLEEWSDKYVSWQLISTLLSLMINKSVSYSNSAIETLEKGVKMSKVNIKNTRTTSISGVFIVNFEQISQLFLVFLLWTLSK